MRLFVGDDWAEDHHDVELMDEQGRVLARRRLPEGVAGMARLHVLIGEQLGEDADDSEVVIGIETDRGPWVAALVAAGYTVFAVEPAAGLPLPGAPRRVRIWSDLGDAHMLTDMARTDCAPAAGGGGQCGTPARAVMCAGPGAGPIRDA